MNSNDIRDYCVNTLCQHAGERLCAGEAVDLGGLIRRFQLASRLEKNPPYPFTLENEEAFRRADDVLGEVYELSLHRLNRKLGPLACIVDEEVDPDTEVRWGYSGLLDHATGTWMDRTLALAEGHPDRHWYAAQELPGNLWRMRSSVDLAA